MPRIVLLPGDGIGPEVVAATVEVLNAVAPDLEYETYLVRPDGSKMPVSRADRRQYNYEDLLKKSREPIKPKKK